MWTIDLTTVFLFIVVLILSLRILRQPKNLPPGPWGWPILGHLLTATQNKKFYIQLEEYRKKYGDVMRLRFGPHYVIVLQSADVIKEALVDKAEYFSERPNYLFLANRFAKGEGKI